MEHETASRHFAALGHPGRLAVVRLLMRHAPQGVRPTEIAATLRMKPNTLSHHLAELEGAGLIGSDREGRSLFYSVRLPALAALISYLGHDCGRGRPDLIPPPPPEIDMRRHFNVLFICSGNSARSIFAEAILRSLGGARFRAFSAGTRPNSVLNPFALEVLERNGLEVTSLRAKHLSEFEGPEAPRMDFVFTVCDQAAADECAPWPGQPLTAHWGMPDPARACGTDAERGLAFAKAFGDLHRRIAALTQLPFDQLERLALQQRLDRLSEA
ncbi:ArsR family transcriptional regulator [Cereibacter sphaeroides]|uniref:metalloregulator ArsR/SmtB family transcription factor n=1 Tax=Cereibacter sphaeroides TaxID=1063 RepID=UPI000E5BAA1A|nr:metalloregulator ArsR/SmtB family transcription factor [Cereibacter sphaeroides]RIA00690.1 ArsR family transcriptional regulator [Cereibacter sphaeroides]